MSQHHPIGIDWTAVLLSVISFPSQGSTTHQEPSYRLLLDPPVSIGGPLTTGEGLTTEERCRHRIRRICDSMPVLKSGRLLGPPSLVRRDRRSHPLTCWGVAPVHSAHWAGANVPGRCQYPVNPLNGPPTISLAQVMTKAWVDES